MKLIRFYCLFLLIILLLGTSFIVYADVPVVEFNNCSVCDSESGFDCGILCGHIKSYGFFNRNLLFFIAKFSFFWSSVIVFILDIILLYTIFFIVFSLNTYGKYLIMTGTRVGRKKLKANPVSADDKKMFWKTYKICSFIWIFCIIFWMILFFLR